MAGAPSPKYWGEVERFPCSGESRELNRGGAAHRGVTSSHPCLLPALLAPAQFQVLSSSKFCFFLFSNLVRFCFFYCFVHLRAAQNAAADPWAPAAAGRGGSPPSSQHFSRSLRMDPAPAMSSALARAMQAAACLAAGTSPWPRLGSCNCHDSASLRRGRICCCGAKFKCLGDPMQKY